jgi:hypothetical protein
VSWLAGLLGVDPDLLRLLAAIFSLVAAVATSTSTVYGVLNRRSRLRAEDTATSTAELVQGLADLLREVVTTPDGVRAIAAAAAADAVSDTVRTELAPVHRFFAAVELVEHRRTHRPETDVIEILRQEIAA